MQQLASGRLLSGRQHLAAAARGFTRPFLTRRQLVPSAVASVNGNVASPAPPAEASLLKLASTLPTTSLRARSSMTQTNGSIYLIIGAMFAGKTSELLRRVESQQDQGQRVLLLKSDKDTRYSADHVVTHDGHKVPCIATSTLLGVVEAHADAYAAAQVIAVDEAQFFPDLAAFVTQAAEVHHKSVIVAGLEGDFKRQKFGQLLDLVPLADNVTKLSGRCFVPHCSNKALFSLRTTAEEGQELVGGADKYRPACRHHYLSHQPSGAAKHST